MKVYETMKLEIITSSKDIVTASNIDPAKQDFESWELTSGAFTQ